MNYKSGIQLFILFVFSLVISFACSKDDDPENTGDPSNLQIEIVSIDEETFTVILQATAYDAVQYHFFLNDEETAEEINDTGLFEYTFEDVGNYFITVRAYGSSGRYTSKEQAVSIAPPQDEPIPLSRGYITPESYTGYDLVWQDEFNGTSLSSEWGYDIGDGCPNCGWGNNELQYYRADNSWVGDSVLTIEARQESFGGKSYTSSRIKTQGNFSFQYGRVDIRALLPEGQGLWPALWMLGANFITAGWPDCGEIDIMEMVGGSGRENEVHGTVHWDNGGDYASYGQSTTLPSGTYNFAEAYHVFTITWDENSIRWYVDDVQFNIIDITPALMTEFHQSFFLIFNVAVGGNWPGSPNTSTFFPQQMKVDYVRVFQEN